MKISISITVLLVVTTLLTGASFAQNSGQTNQAERTAVDITVYNQNLSLIREERSVTLPEGSSTVIVPDIPETIDGTSVHFVSLTDPEAVKVLEQNYQYDLVNQSKLLDKYIGKEVEFIRIDPETKKEFTVKGIILSKQAGGKNQVITMDPTTNGIIAQINGKIEINPAGRLILPSLPEGLILKPQLTWLVTTAHGGKHKTEISYLAGQLSWLCNYVAVLNKDNTSLDLTGWVTLTNNSGTTFKDAGLKLVAGDVNMVREQFDGAMQQNFRVMKEMSVAEPQFKQTNLFEYKLYSLKRRTDLHDDETKQIELVSGKDVASKKVFIYDGMADQWRYYTNDYSYRSQQSFGQQSNPKVGVYVTFKNEEKSGLGIALPKGKIRVYSKDDDGKEQFIGENEIDHTPKDEEIRLYLGNAFDIVGERAQKDFKTYANGHVVEETIEIKVRNHKTEPVTVLVYEHPWRWSQWEITNSETKWEKVDQSTIKFPVTIEKDGERVVTYTIRYSW